MAKGPSGKRGKAWRNSGPTPVMPPTRAGSPPPTDSSGYNVPEIFKLVQDMKQMLTVLMIRQETLVRCLNSGGAITDEAMGKAHQEFLIYKFELDKVMQIESWADKLDVVRKWNSQDADHIPITADMIQLKDWLLSEENESPLEAKINIAEEFCPDMVDRLKVITDLEEQKATAEGASDAPDSPETDDKDIVVSDSGESNEGVSV